MNKQSQNINKSVRFRRWSRVGYAVFASLSAAVTIGVLTVSVSEKSLQKPENHLVAESSILYNNEQEEDEAVEANLQQVEQVVISNQTSDNAAARSLKNYIQSIIAVGTGIACFNRFLF